MDLSNVEKVMMETGCDKWIATKALVSGNFCVEDAVRIVRDRLLYQAQSCAACGEMLDGKWSFCPYCGEQKFGGNDGTTDNET